jgi:AcrR family transcriptional regulator
VPPSWQDAAVSQTPRRARLPAAERRAAILAAALEVFAERGYHGTSIDDVARAAGVSKALIYEYFASKRDLHGLLLGEHVDELFARLQANAAEGGTGEERLRGGIDAFLSFVEAHRDAFRVLFRDAADPEVADALSGVQAQAVGVIVALIEADPESPRHSAQGAETHAALLSGALQGLANWWYDHQDVPRAELVERAMEFAWIGIDGLRRRGRA